MFDLYLFKPIKIDFFSRHIFNYFILFLLKWDVQKCIYSLKYLEIIRKWDNSSMNLFFKDIDV
jgi:hypothetical protein